MVVSSVLWLRGRIFTSEPCPELIEEFSQRHDEQIWRCFCTIAGVAPEAPSPSSRAATSLPLAAGGLGLRSATRLRHVAHWASCADTIKMVHEFHPEVASLKLLRLIIRRPASLPSTKAWRIWWPQGSLLQVGRSSRSGSSSPCG